MIIAFIILAITYALIVGYCLGTIYKNEMEIKRSVDNAAGYILFCFVIVFYYWFKDAFKKK